MVDDMLQIEGAGDGLWVLVAKRASGGKSAEGRANVRAAAAPEPGSASHACLAGARAWRVVAGELLAAGDIAAAAGAADSGIKELGTDYRTPDILDDTTLKYFAAQERLREGHEGDAAANLTRILDSRLKQYASAHAGELG